MPSSALLLSAYESCRRSGEWSKLWRKHRMTPTQMLSEAVNLGLTEPSEDPGQNAGEHFITLAADRGLEISDSLNTHRCAVNHAAIADIVTTAIRSKWQPLEPVGDWTSSCFTADGYLRRFLPVSHWTEDRELFERMSWFCLGEICHYRMPMQLVVANVGHMSGGRRTGYFSKALLHPQKSSLRFRRRARFKIEGFKDTWSPIYREDHGEINREKWLQAMLDDDILQESLFVVTVQVPGDSECKKVCDLSKRQLERLAKITELPDKQLSTCFDAISPCPFRVCCHGEPESGPEAGGFDRT